MSGTEDIKMEELQPLAKPEAEENPTKPQAEQPPADQRSCFSNAFFVDCSSTSVNVQLTGSKVKGSPVYYVLTAEEQAKRAKISSGPGCALLEDELRSRYKDHQPEFADRVAVLIKVGLSFVAYGAPTPHVEAEMRAIAASMGLPIMTLFVSLRSITFQIPNGPYHQVTCSKGFNLDKLKDMSLVTKAICAGQPFDINDLLETVSGINERGGLYGWAWMNLTLAVLLIAAAYAAFLGTWNTVAATACVVPFVILTTQFAGRWEPILVPFVVGVMVPITHRYWVPVDPLEFPKVYLSAILIWLPGSDLTFGALEVFSGSIINGSSRILGAVVKAMLIAMAISIGWQFAGYGMAEEWLLTPVDAIGDKAQFSFVPVNRDSPPYSYYYTFGVGNLLLVPMALCGLELRIRDMFGAFVVIWTTLFVFATLLFYCDGSNCMKLPSMVINFLGMLVGGLLSNAYEYITDIPAIVPTIPIILILAPGSGLVLAGLSLAQNEAETSAHNLFLPILDAVCYTLGMVVATKVCKLCLRRKAVQRAKGFGKEPEDITTDFSVSSRY